MTLYSLYVILHSKLGEWVKYIDLNHVAYSHSTIPNIAQLPNFVFFTVQYEYYMVHEYFITKAVIRIKKWPTLIDSCILSQ
jgi:hypothetical protein